MKHMKKFVSLALVIVSVLAISVPALAASGTVDSTYGGSPGGAVNYYSNYSSNVSTSGLTRKGSLSNGTSITVTVQNDHWYKFTLSGNTRYILRQFVRVSGKEYELRYGTMELNLGCSWTRYVKQLQTDLKALGYYNGTIDGAFGSGTRAAVEAFQTATSGLDVDGRCGPATKQKLYDLVN